MPSKSKTQQRLMGVAYAVKSGDMQLSDVDNNYKDKVKDLVDGMTLKQLKDFAETKHDDLPEEVEEGISPANIGGMGPVQLPTDSEPGSGDVPAGRKSEEDEEDEEKQNEKMKNLIPTFENFIRPQDIDEARDFNDPVLMKMRAAQMKRNQKAAKNNDEATLSPAKAKKIQKLKDERAQIMRDMEQEAEMEGGEIADRYGDMLNKIDQKIIKLGGNPLGTTNGEFKLTEAEEVFEWGGSDQYAMNQTIHKDMGKPKKMPSPFDRKLRAAAEDAVDWYWEEWPEYKTDRAGLIDNAVRSYLRAMFKKDWDIMVRMFEPIDEAFDGNMSDFRYEFPNQFEEVTGNPIKAIKKMAKKGKGFEVRTSTYMSEPEMKEVGDAMGLALVSYEKSSNIAISVYESKANEGMFSSIATMVQNAKSQAQFIKDFFKEFGNEVEKTADSVKWVGSMYKDPAYNTNTKRDFFYNESVEVNESDVWEDLKDMIEDLNDKQYKKYAKQQGFDPKRKNAESMWNWVDGLSGKEAWDSQREIEKEILESVELNEGRSINKIKKDYDKVINDMAAKVKSWKECKANGDTESEARCLADLKDLTAKKKALMSELDDAVGLKDIDAQLAESLDEARSWGTFGTPEAKKVIKLMDKSWDKFSKTVSKAHADFRSEVKSIINSEDGSKSGIVDSEGGSYITGMVNNFARKEFMMDDLGDISRYKYMIDLYESKDNE